MNKVQKKIMLISLVLILFSIIFPPYKAVIDHVVYKTGWSFIFSLGMMDIEGYSYYKQIRFDVLFCEVLAIVVLAGILFVTLKKK